MIRRDGAWLALGSLALFGTIGWVVIDLVAALLAGGR